MRLLVCLAFAFVVGVPGSAVAANMNMLIGYDSGAISEDIYESLAFQISAPASSVSINVEAYAGYKEITSLGRSVSFQVLYSSDGVNYTDGAWQSSIKTMDGNSSVFAKLKQDLGFARRWFLKVRYKIEGQDLPASRTDTFYTKGSIQLVANASFSTKNDVRVSEIIPLPDYSIVGYSPIKTTYSYRLSNTINSYCYVNAARENCGGGFNTPGAGSYVWKENDNVLYTRRDEPGYDPRFLNFTLYSRVYNTDSTSYVNQTLSVSSGKAVVVSAVSAIPKNRILLESVDFSPVSCGLSAPSDVSFGEAFTYSVTGSGLGSGAYGRWYGTKNGATDENGSAAGAVPANFTYKNSIGIDGTYVRWMNIYSAENELICTTNRVVTKLLPASSVSCALSAPSSVKFGDAYTYSVTGSGLSSGAYGRWYGTKNGATDENGSAAGAVPANYTYTNVAGMDGTYIRWMNIYSAANELICTTNRVESRLLPASSL